MHIGYKKIEDDYIVKLEILDGLNTEGRVGIKSENTKFAKYRCQKAKVLDIYHMNDKNKKIQFGYGLYDFSFCYKVGEILEIPDYNNDNTIVCATGIHYFLTEECAYCWTASKIENGPYRYWLDNGLLVIEEFYQDGKKHGLSRQWNDSGLLIRTGHYKNDHPDGEWRSWYKNGKLKCVEFYKNGKPDGIWEYWTENGIKMASESYKDGKANGDWIVFGNIGKVLNNHKYINNNLVNKN